MSPPPAGGPPAEPTDPARPPGRRAVPSHLGRARTSTVALGLLFLAVAALYVGVRPAPVATTGDTTSVVQTPAEPAPSTEPTTTTAPSETTTPTSTSLDGTTPTDPTVSGSVSTTTPEPTGGSTPAAPAPSVPPPG